MDNFGSWLFDGIGCMMIFDGGLTDEGDYIEIPMCVCWCFRS
jgi:hypothetical protein